MGFGLRPKQEALRATRQRPCLFGFPEKNSPRSFRARQTDDVLGRHHFEISETDSRTGIARNAGLRHGAKIISTRTRRAGGRRSESHRSKLGLRGKSSI